MRSVLIRRFSIKTHWLSKWKSTAERHTHTHTRSLLTHSVISFSGEILIWFNILLFGPFFHSVFLCVCFFSLIVEQTVNADKRMIKILCMQFHRTCYRTLDVFHMSASARNQHIFCFVCNWYSLSISPGKQNSSWIIWILFYCWYFHHPHFQWKTCSEVAPKNIIIAWI